VTRVRWSASELTSHLGGGLVGPDVRIEGASIDSRTIRPGQLYIPIVARRDGHAFIPAALEAGAPAYLTAREPVGGTAIRVRDTAAALLSLGALARGRVGGAIGITGSVGKTTTKDLLAGCLASTFPTAASERSFNNELGLPLTLLGAPGAARWVVLEMGVRRVGDIERLAEVARPDVGIVTSVDMAHVEYLGDLDGVARAKAELVAALPASGLAVLNFDDPRVRGMASLCACPVLGYAVGADADVQADDVTLDRDLRARFRLSSPWGADRGPPGVARRAPGRQRAGRGDGRALVWGADRDRGRVTGGEPRLALAHGGPSRARRPRPGRRLFQRDPRVSRGGRALAGRVAGRTQAGAPRGDGRAG
jgi:UDP-N-acetylmuramoyl-tripeptide--D-alanyl-D-alanine ligase